MTKLSVECGCGNMVEYTKGMRPVCKICYPDKLFSVEDTLMIAKAVARPAKDISPNSLVVVLPALEHLLQQLRNKDSND